jgi:hypothetical protein
MLVPSVLFAQGFFFESSAPITTNSHQAVIADMNGDGLPDIVSRDSEGPFRDSSTNVSVFTNYGPGRFALATSVAPLTNKVISLGVADMNNDGRPDLITSHFGPEFWIDQPIVVMTNDGRGGFALQSSVSINRVGMLSPADVNGDGWVDVVYLMPSTGFGVITNTGGGDLVFARSNLVMYYPVALAMGNFNQDDRPDVYVVVDEGPSATFTNDGAGTFTMAQAIAGWDVAATGDSFGIGAWTNGGGLSMALVGSFTAVDVDADGRRDWITATAISNRFCIYTNDGAGRVTLADRPMTPTAPNFVAADDLNGDGRVDLVSVNRGVLSILWNRPGLAVAAERPFPGALVVSWPFTGPEWRLESTTNLFSATTVWTEVPAPYFTNGLRLRRIQANPPSGTYYRLRK